MKTGKTRSLKKLASALVSLSLPLDDVRRFSGPPDSETDAVLAGDVPQPDLDVVHASSAACKP